MAGHLIEWLPEFALTEQERQGIDSGSAVKLIAKAARAVYTTSKKKHRGEIGEILLHAIIRQECHSLPAIAKLYFKDSNNETVKGFDAVHVVQSGQELELWLGESKFYKDIGKAINAVCLELKQHTQNDYLRAEFVAIYNKIDPHFPLAEQLKKLIDRNTSLDVIFKTLCIPVFLTYESPTIANHVSLSTEFTSAIVAEMKQHHSNFVGRDLPNMVRIHLLLLPLGSKSDLINKFDERLKKCQNLTA